MTTECIASKLEFQELEGPAGSSLHRVQCRGTGGAADLRTGPRL